MNIYIVIAILIFCIFYFGRLIYFFFKFMRTNELIEDYSKIQVEVKDNSNYDNLKTRSDAVMKIRAHVIPDIPIINKLIPEINCGIFAYQSDEEVYNSFQVIRSALLTRLYEFKQEAKDSINPIYAIQDILLVPSVILAWLGIKQTISSSRIFSVLAWIIGFVVSNYGKDIISFIINNFVHH